MAILDAGSWGIRGCGFCGGGLGERGGWRCTLAFVARGTGGVGGVGKMGKGIWEDGWRGKFVKLVQFVKLDAGWFFPSPDGKRWDADDFSQDLRAANGKFRLSWECLDYRHTFGTQLATKHESLYKVSTLFGNSPEICRRHYAALVPETLANSVEFTQPNTPRLNVA